ALGVARDPFPAPTRRSSDLGVDPGLDYIRTTGLSASEALRLEWQFFDITNDVDYRFISRINVRSCASANNRTDIRGVVLQGVFSCEDERENHSDCINFIGDAVVFEALQLRVYDGSANFCIGSCEF